MYCLQISHQGCLGYHWISFNCRKTFIMTWCLAPSPLSVHFPALLRWKVPSWTKVKQALPAASFQWGFCLPTDWAVSLPPAATEPLLRPPASWSVPWDLHSDFLQLAFPFLSPSYLTWASLHLKCTHIRPCLSLNKYVFIEMSLLWMKPTV